MPTEPSGKNIKLHTGENIRRARVYFGVKQEVLAADLGISQRAISKIEQQEEVEDNLLVNIAEVMGISVEVLRGFDEKKALSITDNSFRNNSFEEIVKSFERLLKNEREKIEILLKNKFNNKGYDSYTSTNHIGKKIGGVRRLHKMTQTELGNALGITKQAVSKMEKTEKIEDKKIMQVADALGITVDVIKSFNEQSASNYIHDRYKKKGITLLSMGTNNDSKTGDNFLTEKLIEQLQKLLQKEIEQFEKTKRKMIEQA